MPILEERCLKCHGHVKESGKVVTKGDLDITKPDSVKEFLKAGHPGDSSFYTLVISDDEDEYMPPKGDRLSDANENSFTIGLSRVLLLMAILKKKKANHCYKSWQKKLQFQMQQQWLTLSKWEL